MNLGPCKRCSDASTLLCIICGGQAYCSRRCQIEDWDEHRKSCRRKNILLVDESEDAARAALNIHTLKLRINENIANPAFNLKSPTSSRASKRHSQSSTTTR